jgi:hypothetical protein
MFRLPLEVVEIRSLRFLTVAVLKGDGRVERGY